METGYVYVLLWAVCITFVIGIMIGWEIGLASGSLAALCAFFIKASESNSSPLWAYAGIVFTFVFIITSVDSVKRILTKHSRKLLFDCTIQELGKLRIQGVDLLHKGLNNATDDKLVSVWWQEEIPSWKKAVSAQMCKIHPAHSQNWETLGTFPPNHSGDVIAMI